MLTLPDKGGIGVLANSYSTDKKALKRQTYYVHQNSLRKFQMLSCIKCSRYFLAFSDRGVGHVLTSQEVGAWGGQMLTLAD